MARPVTHSVAATGAVTVTADDAGAHAKPVSALTWLHGELAWRHTAAQYALDPLADIVKQQHDGW